jgi:hypothetical protein
MSTGQSDFTAYGGSEAIPDGACVRYEQCENTVPEDGRICGQCLDELRAADRERCGDASRI